MRCACGRYITGQATAIAGRYKVPEVQCIHCMADLLMIPYDTLLAEYLGIYECRPCARDNKRNEMRRRLLGVQ